MYRVSLNKNNELTSLAENLESEKDAEIGELENTISAKETEISDLEDIIYELEKTLNENI